MVPLRWGWLASAIDSGMGRTGSAPGERTYPPSGVGRTGPVPGERIRQLSFSPPLRAAFMVGSVSSRSCSVDRFFGLFDLHLLEPVCRSWGPFLAEGSRVNTGLVLVCCLASQMSESLGVATRLA